VPESDDGFDGRPARESPAYEHVAVHPPLFEPGFPGLTSWAAGAARHPWRTFTSSWHPWRRVAVIVALVAGGVIGGAVRLAAQREDFRSYRDQMTTYVSNATQHDSSGAAPYTCAAIRTAFEADAKRWDDALRDQDLALGQLHLSQQRLRGAPDMASVAYQRETGDDVTLHIPVVEEDGELLMCPDPQALFGSP